MAQAEGEKFLADVEKQPGVHKLPSGLRFRIVTRVDNAEGVKSPNLADSCSVHYHGSLPNGKVFDSSMQRGKPSTFAPNQVIKGWTEALQYMAEGEEWEVYLPPSLAYGDAGAGGVIPGKATLIFKIQLIKVMSGGKSGSAGHASLEKALGRPYAQL